MGKRKLNDKRLLGLVDEGLSLAEIARLHGISRQATSKRLIELRGKTTKAVVAKRVNEIVERKIDALEQLHKINSYANELLDLLMRWNRGDDEALQVLETQVRKIRIGKGENVEWVKEYKFKDPRELALRAMGEIRGQMSLQLEIFKTMSDLETIREFQAEVLTAIGETSKEVRDAIIKRLKEKRALRTSVQVN